MPYDPERHGPRRIVGAGFHDRVFAVVRTVPAGRVTSYGDVAAALGLRSVARKVGHALAVLPTGTDVPWHRVVNAQGRLSRSPDTPAGRRQRDRLEAEGIPIDGDGRIRDFHRLRYQFPNERTIFPV